MPARVKERIGFRVAPPRAGHGHKTVLLHILGSVAPGLAPGIGAVAADDKAHLGHILRHVHHALDTVGAGMEELAAPVSPGVPEPHIALGIVRRRVVPVERQLIAAGLPFQEKLFLRRRLFRGSSLFGGRFLRRFGLLRSGLFLRTLSAGRKQGNQHQQRQEQGQQTLCFHVYSSYCSVSSSLVLWYHFFF